MRGSFTLAVAVCLLQAAFAFSAFAQDGVSIAVVAVGADTPSEPQAVTLAQLARLGFDRNPKYSPVDLERLLDDGNVPAGEAARARAKSALSQCRGAYDALELSVATENCAEAIVAFEQGLAELTDIKPLIEAIQVQGAAYTLDGDTKNARRAFERIHILAPGTTLPSAYPDTVKEVFESAEARVAKKSSGKLTVYATPSAAEVWVDGRFRGSAPITVDNLVEGRHLVRVVRDGYQDFGSTADVRRRREETVQATLKPTAKLSQYDALLSRLRSGGDKAPGELAQLLKVDQLLWLLVDVKGADVTVTGTLTDGVSGAPITSATKSFVAQSSRYRSDVELWVAESFRKADARDVGDDIPSDKLVGNPDDKFLAERPSDDITPPKVILGWSLVGVGSAGIATFLGSGAYSLYTWDIYKNQGQLFGAQGIPDQLNPELDNVRNAFLVSSVIADVGLVVGLVGIGVGVWAVVDGQNEEEALEDVLSMGAPSSSPLGLAPLPIGVAP